MSNFYTFDPKFTPSYLRFWEQFKAKCTNCGWEKIFQFMNGMDLKIGDPLPSGGDDPNFNTCMRCKLQTTLKVISVPLPSPPAKPAGFWKVPTKSS